MEDLEVVGVDAERQKERLVFMGTLRRPANGDGFDGLGGRYTFEHDDNLSCGIEDCREKAVKTVPGDDSPGNGGE